MLADLWERQFKKMIEVNNDVIGGGVEAGVTNTSLTSQELSGVYSMEEGKNGYLFDNSFEVFILQADAEMKLYLLTRKDMSAFFIPIDV